MITKPTSIDSTASRVLARHGVAFIWEPHMAAAAAYGLGKLSVARDLTEIAEAAEREWAAATGNEPLPLSTSKHLDSHHG